MSDLWILAYLLVTISGSGRISYEPVELPGLELKVCFETMWQLDEVYAPLDKGEYKKFVEISCKLEDIE